MFDVGFFYQTVICKRLNLYRVWNERSYIYIKDAFALNNKFNIGFTCCGRVQVHRLTCLVYAVEGQQGKRATFLTLFTSDFCDYLILEYLSYVVPNVTPVLFKVFCFGFVCNSRGSPMV